ncbi:MAG: alpha/beta hydrolase [Rhodobacteraceae bacterium]|nr:alpha/beta hydrolase [Paracoccaceae bacterium]
MDNAPLHTGVADGPEGGRAFWLRARDGVRLRAGLWQVAGARGTVFVFPGRTEYVEKYGRAAADLAAAGLNTLTIDWRGQGLADRLIDDAMPGHVLHFSDYQQDVDALVESAAALNLPKPWYLLAHSMGGAIGLRALTRDMPVAACAFSGPMWGIKISTALRPVAWSLSWSSRRVGLCHKYAPGTTTGSYVLTEPFETNRLTGDRDMYDYMVRQVTEHPELALGGPSLRWLHEALKDTLELSRRPSPDLPCFTFYGSDEDIVDVTRIETRLERWPGIASHVVPGGRHEVLMESRDMRTRLFGQIAGFFDDAGSGPSPRRVRSDADGPARSPSIPSHLQRQGIA